MSIIKTNHQIANNNVGCDGFNASNILEQSSCPKILHNTEDGKSNDLDSPGGKRNTQALQIDKVFTIFYILCKLISVNILFFI